MSEEPLLQFEETHEDSDLKHAVKTLLDPEHTQMTTELNNPLAISVLESLSEFLHKDVKQVAELLFDFVSTYKLNMIAYNRKRAAEAIEIARASAGITETDVKERLRSKLLDVLAK